MKNNADESTQNPLVHFAQEYFTVFTDLLNKFDTRVVSALLGINRSLYAQVHFHLFKQNTKFALNYQRSWLGRVVLKPEYPLTQLSKLNSSYMKKYISRTDITHATRFNSLVYTARLKNIEFTLYAELLQFALSLPREDEYNLGVLRLVFPYLLLPIPSVYENEIEKATERQKIRYLCDSVCTALLQKNLTQNSLAILGFLAQNRLLLSTQVNTLYRKLSERITEQTICLIHQTLIDLLPSLIDQQIQALYTTILLEDELLFSPDKAVCKATSKLLAAMLTRMNNPELIQPIIKHTIKRAFVNKEYLHSKVISQELLPRLSADQVQELIEPILKTLRAESTLLAFETACYFIAGFSQQLKIEQILEVTGLIINLIPKFETLNRDCLDEQVGHNSIAAATYVALDKLLRRLASSLHKVQPSQIPTLGTCILKVGIHPAMDLDRRLDDRMAKLLVNNLMVFLPYLRFEQIKEVFTELIDLEGEEGDLSVDIKLKFTPVAYEPQSFGKEIFHSVIALLKVHHPKAIEIGCLIATYISSSFDPVEKKELSIALINLLKHSSSSVRGRACRALHTMLNELGTLKLEIHEIAVLESNLFDLCQDENPAVRLITYPLLASLLFTFQSRRIHETIPNIILEVTSSDSFELSETLPIFWSFLKSEDRNRAQETINKVLSRILHSGFDGKSENSLSVILPELNTDQILSLFDKIKSTISDIVADRVYPVPELYKKNINIITANLPLELLQQSIDFLTLQFQTRELYALKSGIPLAAAYKHIHEKFSTLSSTLGITLTSLLPRLRGERVETQSIKKIVIPVIQTQLENFGWNLSTCEGIYQIVTALLPDLSQEEIISILPDLTVLSLQDDTFPGKLALANFLHQTMSYINFDHEGFASESETKPILLLLKQMHGYEQKIKEVESVRKVGLPPMEVSRLGFFENQGLTTTNNPIPDSERGYKRKR